MGSGVAKRVAAMSAALDALLAEPLEMLSTADQLALAHQWETLTRRQAAMGHRLCAVLAQAPVAELGAPTAAAALSTLLRITKDEAGHRVREARDLAPRLPLGWRGCWMIGQLSEADGARRRDRSLGRQQSDGMSEVRGRLDPRAARYLTRCWPNWSPPGCAIPMTNHRVSTGRRRTGGLSASPVGLGTGLLATRPGA